MKISKRQLRNIVQKAIMSESPTMVNTGMTSGGKGPMPGLSPKSRSQLQKELRTQLDSLRASGKTDNIPPEWLENLEKAKSHDMDPKFNLYMDEERGGPTDEELMALQKELNPTLFGKFKKMFGFGENARMSEDQLRNLIRETMAQGNAGMQSGQYAIDDYEKWVKEEGHVTPAASSVMATYFLSFGIESQGFMKKLAKHYKIDFRDVMRDYDRQEAEGNVVRGEGVVRISESRLRKIIAKSILKETQATFHSRRNIPRSVQADYDIANKEDTFPKAKAPKGPNPNAKSSYEMIHKELTSVLQDMPGYKSIMYDEAAYVDAKRKDVIEMLKPVIAKVGAEAKDGHTDETFIRHPDGIMVTVFGSGTGTEIDFGPTPEK